MKEIKNPLKANIDRSNGNIEISIAKKYSESEEPMYKKFMGMCAMNDSYAVETGDMDDDQTVKACGSFIKKNEKDRSMLKSIFIAKPAKPMLAGLTEKQKKNLPPALQKAILKKMKDEGKITEEAEAAYSKLLSKDDQKERRSWPRGRT